MAGGARLNWQGPAFEKAVRAHLRRNLSSACIALVNYAWKLISINGTGVAGGGLAPSGGGLAPSGGGSGSGVGGGRKGGSSRRRKKSTHKSYFMNVEGKMVKVSYKRTTHYNNVGGKMTKVTTYRKQYHLNGKRIKAPKKYYRSGPHGRETHYGFS